MDKDFVALCIKEYDCQTHENKTIVFKVSTEWLKEYLEITSQENNATIYSSLENFTVGYSSEDAREVYYCAGLVNEIKGEKRYE